MIACAVVSLRFIEPPEGAIRPRAPLLYHKSDTSIDGLLKPPGIQTAGNRGLAACSFENSPATPSPDRLRRSPFPPEFPLERGEGVSRLFSCSCRVGVKS